MRIVNTIYSMLFNRCPRCHHGHVFTSPNPYNLGKIFNLHPTCSHCGLKYEREPSFFYGSLYVSYALTSGWFTIWFALFMNDMLPFSDLTFAALIGISLVILSPLTIRWSRLVWLNFFYKYNKQYKLNKANSNTQLS